MLQVTANVSVDRCSIASVNSGKDDPFDYSDQREGPPKKFCELKVEVVWPKLSELSSESNTDLTIPDDYEVEIPAQPVNPEIGNTSVLKQ